jgi:putative membrane protein
MMRAALLVIGTGILMAAWLGPLPDLAKQWFAAHMTMHMLVVAVAAPLLALALAGTRIDPVRANPALFAPIPASLAEFAIVWVWHVPAWHRAARHDGWALIVEQASFLVAGLILWLAACGGDRKQWRHRGGAGVAALLFTSMHVTLLGALFALANRPLYGHGSGAVTVSQALADQHLGGAIMLLVGGSVYLFGGLSLTAGLMHASASRREVA